MKTKKISREVPDQLYDIAMVFACAETYENYLIIIELDQDGYEVFVKNKRNGNRAEIPGKSLSDMILNAELAAYTASQLDP